MTLLRAAWLIAKKDLRIEARSGEIAMTSGFFAVLVAVIASLSFYVDDATAQRIAPGVLWISVAFAGVLAMGRTWARERDEQAYVSLRLSPLPHGALFFGKLLSTLSFLFVVEALLLPAIAVLFHVELLPIALPLLLTTFLGTLGFAAPGTLFFSMTLKTGARDLLLAIVLFAIATPALLAAVVATREVLLGSTLADLGNWLRVLVAADVVYVASGFILLDVLLDE